MPLFYAWHFLALLYLTNWKRFVIAPNKPSLSSRRSKDLTKETQWQWLYEELGAVSDPETVDCVYPAEYGKELHHQRRGAGHWVVCMSWKVCFVTMPPDFQISSLHLISLYTDGNALHETIPFFLFVVAEKQSEKEHWLRQLLINRLKCLCLWIINIKRIHFFRHGERMIMWKKELLFIALSTFTHCQIIKETHKAPSTEVQVYLEVFLVI